MGELSMAALPSSYPLLGSIRLWFYVAGAGTTMVWIGLYTSLNFAWVCMVNDTALHLNASGYDGDLDWGKGQQKVAFSAYNLGGVLSFVLPGYLMDRFGARRVGTVAILVSSLATASVPLLAYVSLWALSAARALTGFFTAFAWPLVYALLSHWAPKGEMGRAMMVAATGFPLGQFLSIAMDGLECSRLGWPYVSYIASLAGVLWACLWAAFYRDDPPQCAWLSPEESEFILLNRDRKTSKQKIVPWKSIFTARPVYACMLSYLTQWQFIFFVSGFGPTYLKEVLLVPVESNGIFSAIPLLGFTLGRWVGGFVSDMGFRSMTFRTKLCNSVFAFGGSAACVALSFVREDTPSWVATMFMFLLLAAGGFSTGGYQKSVVLLAPQYSGVVGSLINIVGSSGAFVMPYLLAALTPDGTALQWSHFFFYLAATGVVAGVVFIAFGTGELQEWAKPAPQSLVEMGVTNLAVAEKLEAEEARETKTAEPST